MPKYHYDLIINEDRFKKVDDKEAGSNFFVLYSASLESREGKRGVGEDIFPPWFELK